MFNMTCSEVDGEWRCWVLIYDRDTTLVVTVWCARERVAGTCVQRPRVQMFCRLLD